MTRSCDESFVTLITPSTAAFSALLAEQDSLTTRYEGLTLESRCIPRLATEAKELWQKRSNHEKTNVTVRAAPKGHGQKHATAGNKRVGALEIELADTETAHARLVGVFARSELDTTKA